MPIEISDNPALQATLVAKMGQGFTAANLEAPKPADVASFRAQSAADQEGHAETLKDEFGNSQNTSALPKVNSSGNAHQTDRSGHNIPLQADTNASEEAIALLQPQVEQLQS